MTLRPRDLLARRGDPLQLESLTGETGLDRALPQPDIASPGLALAGYVERFVPTRLHVLGETEVSYLTSLPDEVRRATITTFFVCWMIRSRAGRMSDTAEIFLS